MATKAKLTLSQLLFRRTSNNNNNGSSSSNNNSQNANHSDASRNEQFSGGGEKSGGSGNGTASGSAGNSFGSISSHSSTPISSGAVVHRKMSGGSVGNISSKGGGGRQAFYEHAQPPDIMKGNPSSKSLPSIESQQNQYHRQTPQQQVQQQLHGILKKPTVGSEGGFGGRTHRSSLHRSKSNPNPSNNPLKEVSWSCPTLEKRREVILNYFERIILENKQEQNGKNKNTTKPNIPCEPGNNGEPIYEEISDFSSSPCFISNSASDNKMGSLKPKLGPKKVRMNIPQDQPRNVNINQSPIYDKVLCRSHSMHESSTSSSVSSSSFYDIAPSTATSVSSGSHSLYENFRPSSYYAASSSSSESDYGIVGGGGGYANNGNGKNTGSRIAARSHSFHDNYRNSGNYNIQAAPLATTAAVDTDQLYAKVCKRKKLKATSNNELPQQNHHRPSAYPTAAITTTKADYEEMDNQDELRVQVSCGNVVTMIPVMMPCSVAAASSFSTSCLSLSSSSDNNNDDNNLMTITTSISSINTRNNTNHHNNKNTNGLFHYEAEKIIPDKNFAYMNSKNEGGGGGGGDSCPPSSAAARNRNNLSVIHLLAAYDPAKEIEEFIPTPSFTAIIDSTECAPKSISVPVRVGFSSSTNSSSANSNNRENEEYPSSRQPLMVTNCSFGYDNDAFQADDDGEDADADEEDNNNDHHHHKNFLRSSSNNNTTTNAKDIPSSATSNSSTSGADDGDDAGSCTSDTDTDEDEHQTQKYSFTNNGNGRGILKNNHHHHQHHHHRVKSITFQEDNNTTPAKDFLLLTTSESEDDEELCEHKSLIEMNTSPTTGSTILDDSSGKGDKYGMSLMDDEDRGFDSFLDDSENGHGENGKGDSPFSSENMKNQRTFAQMTQGVPQEQLKKKAASVLDLINSEISDLHMRELELKKLHGPSPPQMTKTGGVSSGKDKDEQEMHDGSAEEFEEGSSGEDDFSDSAIEYDGFTTNGSHSSGQVSPSENLNEMINHHQDEKEKVVELDTNNAEEEEEANQPGDQVDLMPGPRSEVTVRPLDEEEDRSIKFLVSDETPIEREIRLTREREEEFRRNNHNYLAICPPAPATMSPKGTASLPIMKTRDVSSRPESQSKPEMASFPMDKSSTAAKDKQLELATARFKKEIEESMEREKELLREARQKKDVNEEEVTEVIEAPKEKEENENVAHAPTTPTSPPQQQSTPPQAAAENQTQLRKPTIAKLPIAKLPAARFFAPPAFNANKPSRITPVVSPIINKGAFGFPTSANNSNAPVVGGSLPMGISRPSYTSFEKYIRQTSLNYMASKQNGNNSAAATPTSPSVTTTQEEPVKITTGPIVADPGVANKNLQFNIPEDPLRIIQKPAEDEESNEGDKEDEDEKPKRRYIPAQDKITKEIQELAMREKELNHTRAKWKSTLDLPEALKDAEEEKETLRRTTSTTQSSLSLNTTSAISSDDNIVVAATPAEDTSNNDGESDELNLTNVTSEDVRQVTRVKAPARRRHSLLINQWEERIRQQQQQNSKK